MYMQHRYIGMHNSEVQLQTEIHVGMSGLAFSYQLRFHHSIKVHYVILSKCIITLRLSKHNRLHIWINIVF